MALIQTDRTAALVIDLQRDNMTEGAWPVHGYRQVLEAAAEALAAARSAGIPVVYTRHWLSPTGKDAQRWEPRDERGGPLHSIAGTPGAQICDEVAPEPADVVIDKQRYSGFYGTRLDAVLTQMDAEHLIVMGVWTEACLATSVYDAVWRDYRVTLVKDACGAATEAVHKTGILNMANWLHGGTILDASELSKALAGQAYRGWHFEAPNEFPFTLDSVDDMYGQL